MQKAVFEGEERFPDGICMGYEFWKSGDIRAMNGEYSNGEYLISGKYLEIQYNTGVSRKRYEIITLTPNELITESENGIKEYFRKGNFDTDC